MYPQKPLVEEHSYGTDFLLVDVDDEAVGPSAEVTANPGIPSSSGGIVFEESLEPSSNGVGQFSNQQPMIGLNDSNFDSTSSMLPVVLMARSFSNQTVPPEQQMGDPGIRLLTNGRDDFPNQQANRSEFTQPITMDSLRHFDLNPLSNSYVNNCFDFETSLSDPTQFLQSSAMSNNTLPQSTFDTINDSHTLRSIGRVNQPVGGNNYSPSPSLDAAQLAYDHGCLESNEPDIDIENILTMMNDNVDLSNPSPVNTTSQCTDQMFPNVGVTTVPRRGTRVVDFNAQDSGGFAASRMPEEVMDMSLNTGMTHVQSLQQIPPAVQSIQNNTNPPLFALKDNPKDAYDLQALGIQKQSKVKFPQAESVTKSKLEIKRQKNKLSARKSRQKKTENYKKALKEYIATKQINDKLIKKHKRYEEMSSKLCSYLDSIQKPTPMEEAPPIDSEEIFEMALDMEESYLQEPPPTSPPDTHTVPNNDNNNQSIGYSPWSVGHDDSEDDNLVEFFKNKKHN